MKIGEIYFIREHDRLERQHSSYVKIGLVNSTQRNSEERLLDHQTGNPRDLVIHHVVQTPSPFWVERGLHHRLGRMRVRGEWFLLEADELSTSVALAEELAREAFQYVDIIQQAEELADVVSSGVVLPSTPEAHEWLDHLSRAHVKIKACKAMSDQYKAVFGSLSQVEKEEVEADEIVVTEAYLHKEFDREGFDAANPGVTEKYTSITETVSGSFVPKYIKHVVSELDRELTEFQNVFLEACQNVIEKSMTFSDLAELHRDLESHQNAYEWEKTIADANLRMLCGTADGLDGLCTWKRTKKEKVEFDRDSLQFDYPDQYASFLKTEMRNRQKTKKRPSRKTS